MCLHIHLQEHVHSADLPIAKVKNVKKQRFLRQISTYLIKKHYL